MTETELVRAIQLDLSTGDVRLWRNNVGLTQPIVSSKRRVRYGLCPGSSDLIGLRSVVITGEMVGRRVGIFAAVEVKTEQGRATHEQLSFIRVVQELGGLSGIARSIADARLILTP